VALQRRNRVLKKPITIMPGMKTIGFSRVGGCAAIKQKESWSGKTGFHLNSCIQLLNRRTLSSLAALLFGQQHAFDERINAAVQHIVHIAHIQADAVILDHLVGV